WIHTPLVLGVIAALPYGRWLHLFVIPATVVLRPERAMAALEPLDMAAVEETGKVGLGAITDLDRWQLMSLDGCMECGRCTDACPAHAVGKVLDPKRIVLQLRSMLDESRSDRAATPADDAAAGATDAASRGSTDVVSDEALWACTNCSACVRECPALIRHVDIIDGIRQYRVAEGRVSGPAATMLRQLTSRENPWGLPAYQRMDWAKGLELAGATTEDGREVLLWVGCAGAFESRAQASMRALAALLTAADVRFTVLGTRERCTGDPARRTGDELLFQQLAEENITTLKSIGGGTIVTQCPHCFHTMKNEYPQLGGDFEVLHHTQFLERLVQSGRLRLAATYGDKVTYHDPCFLARVNGETAAPRSLLAGALKAPLAEPARRESKTFCCGAGGGRMWMEEPPGQRPGVERARELIRAGAKTVAVGCPFCKAMLGDCVAQAAGEAAPAVKDISEIMLAAIQSDPASG
ncbi:MAG TPA: (Fe-S)-binding protein, partial [Chthonomonadaceae bacterium]|nr:(Fe-S)-binding protein [Chthonomonadaceae bacterium]